MTNGQNWSETSDIGKDFDRILKTFGKDVDGDTAYELTMATMLKKYNMGIVLAKQDTNGDFKGIFTKEVKDTNDPTKITYAK